MTIKFICKQCGKEYYKPDCFKNIKPSFCCKECRNSYSRHKHIIFKQNEFIIKDGYCLLNNYFKKHFPTLEKAIQWRERMEQELNFYRGGV